MSATRRTVLLLALVPTAVLLAGFITWGGNVDIPVAGNEFGTIDYVDDP